MQLGMPVFAPSASGSADAEAAGSSPGAARAAAEWDDWAPGAARAAAEWDEWAEEETAAPQAASSSAYVGSAAASSTALWDAEPLTPPGSAEAIWDRWDEAAPRVQPRPSHQLQAQPKWSLPKRKIEAAEELLAFPKMKPKPPDTSEFKREVSARTADDRKRVRDWEDDSERPWDARGPRGPSEGGPKIWMGQKFREGSGRWANAGGQHREKYTFYHRKKKEGLYGDDLQYYHPMAEHGYWAKKAREDGVLCPFEMKQARDNDEI